MPVGHHPGLIARLVAHLVGPAGTQGWQASGEQATRALGRLGELLQALKVEFFALRVHEQACKF